jgi:L-aminopeptidase/D-esterase-like protein
MIQAVHAVVLSGGSAFGLEASSGVMECLAERGIGFKLGEACVPIVVGACLFDLLLGDNLQGRKDYIAENGSLYLDMADIS